jgi:hypothetical protein
MSRSVSAFIAGRSSRGARSDRSRVPWLQGFRLTSADERTDHGHNGADRSVRTRRVVKL